MKKIYFIINSLEMGGAERAILRVIRHLKKNYDFIILTLKDSKGYDAKNINTQTLTNAKTNMGMITHYFCALCKLKKIIKKNPDAKFISLLELSNFLNILTSREPIISFRTQIDFFTQPGIKNKIYRFLIKRLYPKAKEIIVNSEENKIDIIKRLGINPKKIKVVYNSIDVNEIQEGKKEKVEDLIIKKIKGKKVLVSVSRLNTVKRIELLINTMKNINDSVLLVIGGGPEEKNLQELITKLQLDQKVYLLGKQHNVFKYLNIADYFVYSSKVEGMPNTLLEALGSGVPIITSNFKTGGKEIIDPELDLTKKIKLPYFGPNGTIITNDPKKYPKELANVLNSKKEIKQEQKGLNRFTNNEWIKYLEQITK